METNLPKNEHIPVKRIAALDLGTNSFHVIIVDVFMDGSFRMVDGIKETVQLAMGGVDKNLTPAAMKRGWKALKNIKTLCDSHEAEIILAYATSAIREAENGGDFIQKIREELGIKIQPIPGIMEAELIGYAVQHGIKLGKKPQLIVDIGGGSVEFIVVDMEKFHFLESKKIGVARMTNQFKPDDPIEPTQIQVLENHYRNELKNVKKTARDFKIKRIIGSSGTMENIALMIAGRNNIPVDITLNEFEYKAADFLEFYQYFIKLDAEERAQVPGLDAKRVEIINAGLVLLNVIVRDFGIEKIKISTQALREGIIIRYLQKETELLRKSAAYTNPRKRSIFELLRKCRWHEVHSRHVAEMALYMFDALKEKLKLPESDRELLQYASYLHDIGYYISHSAHHKHAMYIVRNADLKGFTEEEIEILAQVARYHRKSLPKITHYEYQKLPQNVKERIKKLAGILRVADGLDRSHFQNVTDLKLTLNPDELLIKIQGNAEANLEIWGAYSKSDLLQLVLQRKIIIVNESAAD